jgi:uncharacterized membrane protein YqhA
MTTFITILLIVILVLVASDVFFLYKIYKDVGEKKKGLLDEKYFELKYNINLLKAVSAIVIFLIGFLGFTTYGEIIKNVEKDISTKYSEQNTRIDSLTHILSKYELFVDSLELRKNESVQNLDDINRKFNLLNRKLDKNEEALQIVPQIFIVKNVSISEDEQKINFSSLRTIDNQKLPNFKEPPIVNMQCLGADILVSEVTTKYIEFTNWVTGKNHQKANCDLWIVYLR